MLQPFLNFVERNGSELQSSVQTSPLVNSLLKMFNQMPAKDVKVEDKDTLTEKLVKIVAVGLTNYVPFDVEKKARAQKHKIYLPMPDVPDYRCYLPNLFNDMTQTLSRDWKDPIETFIFSRFMERQMGLAWKTHTKDPEILPMHEMIEMYWGNFVETRNKDMRKAPHCLMNVPRNDKETDMQMWPVYPAPLCVDP